MTKTTLKDSLTPEEVAKLGPQDQLVHEYLVSGRALTTMVALVNLGVGSLSRRITTLRKAGLNVVKEWGEDHFQRRYKKYSVPKPAEGEEKDHA